MAISDVGITVIDFESTGSLPGCKDEPWQIGMVSINHGKVDPLTMFESLLRVDAARPFNPRAPGRHGLLRAQIAVAPTLHSLWPEIKGRLTGHPLCAHNAATERKFTRAVAPLHRFGPWIDTLRIARKAWPGLQSYALEDLASTLGLGERLGALCAGREFHDALYDAVAAALLLEHLLEQPDWAAIKVGDLVSA